MNVKKENKKNTYMCQIYIFFSQLGEMPLIPLIPSFLPPEQPGDPINKRQTLVLLSSKIL